MSETLVRCGQETGKHDSKTVQENFPEETVKHEQHCTRDNTTDKFSICLEGLIILSGEQENSMNGDKKKKKINKVKVSKEMITLWKHKI